MEVQLLGPVALVGHRGEVAMARSHCRAVLAVLALDPGRPVSMDALIRRVWGDEPPQRAAHALHTHVSTLRGALRQADEDAVAALRRVSGGYLLDVDPGNIDLHRARRLVAEAAVVANGQGDPDRRAVDLLRRACREWRGVPLAGMTGSWAAGVREGLDQERLAMHLERYRWELRLGDHAHAVGPLAELLADYPLVEPLVELQMLALYRCGRQAEALALYARTRQQLVDALGDDPGAGLQRLHEQILRRDPKLVPEVQPPYDAADSQAPPPVLSITPAQLPADVAGFTGRDSALAWLNSLLPAAPDGGPATATRVAVLDGVAGIGKTALAVHWAHQVRGRFPDGQLYVDLRGYAPGPPRAPLEVVARFLHALGLPGTQQPSDLDDATALYRSILADKRVLIILDNAASAEQVRPLLPAGSGSLVLVTSRDQLGGLVVRDGAHRSGVGVFTDQESRTLLATMLGADRVEAEPEAVTELAELCGHLPLALRVAAANLTGGPWTLVTDYLVRLREQERLSALRAPGEAHSAVSAALDLSYAKRSAPQQRMFRLLGLVPGPEVSLEAAAALAGVGADEARQLLRMLTAAHLVVEPAEGRFSQHDLLRHYAAERAARDDTESEQQAAVARLYDFYLHTVDAGTRLLYPEKARLPIPDRPGGVPVRWFRDRADALTWLNRELPVLVAAVRGGATWNARRVWRLADALRGYFTVQRPIASWLAVAEAGLAAAEADGEPSGWAAAHLSLGGVHFAEDKYPPAIEHYQRVLLIIERTTAGPGERPGWITATTSTAHNNLGAAYQQSGRLREAADQFEQALALRQASSSDAGPGAALQLTNLAGVKLALGQVEQALCHYTEALRIHRVAGSGACEAVDLRQLGICHHLVGRPDRAIDHLTQALPLHRSVGDRANEASTRCCLAAVYRDTGGPALAHASAALTYAREASDRRQLVEALNTLASIYDDDGHQRRAIDSYQEARQVARETGVVDGYAQALAGSARALLQLGDRESARDQVTEAVAITQETGYRLIEAYALRVLAEVHVADGNPDQARDAGEQALAIAEAGGVRWGLAAIHAVLSPAYEQLGNIASARSHRRHAEALSVNAPALTSVRESVEPAADEPAAE